jgi:hypothetical protein
MRIDKSIAVIAAAVNTNLQQLSASAFCKFLIGQVKMYYQMVDSGRPLPELNVIRNHIQRMYGLLENHERVLLTDIFGDRFLQILI